MSGRRRSATGGEEPHASVGRAAAAVDLIDAKPRMAYIGGERQDKYARYGWNLRVRDLVATGLHRTDLLLRPVTRSQARRVAATLRACGLARTGEPRNSCRCPTERSGSRCWRAPWCRIRTGCCWMSSTTAWMPTTGGASTRCSRRAPPRPVLGRDARIAPMDVPRGTRSLIELADGRSSCRQAAARQRILRRLSDARAGESARRRARAARREPRRAARGPCCCDCRSVDLYVDYRAVLRDVELAAARGRALGGIRRERRRQIQFPEAAVRRSVAGAGRSDRARRISAGHADRRMEAAGGLRLAGTADRLCGRCHRVRIWWRAAAIRASGSRTRRRRHDLQGGAALAQILRAARRSPSAGRASCPTGSCAARSSRARWRRIARILLLDEPLTGLDPGSVRMMKRLLERLMRRD